MDTEQTDTLAPDAGKEVKTITSQTTDAAKADAALEAKSSEAKVEKTEVLDDAEDVDTDIDDDVKEDTKDEPKKKSGSQRRKEKIERLAREVELWREEALKNRQPEAKVDPAKTETPAVDADAKPNPDDFDSHEAWLDARDEWRDRQRDAKAAAKAKEDSLKSEFETKKSTHQKRLEEFAKQTPDFEETMEDFKEDLKGINVPMALDHAIVESDFGPQLMYELAQDKGLLERLCKMSFAQINKEIGKLETRFEKSSETEKTPESKTTKAPKPITPVSAGSSSAGKKTIYDKGLSFAEYERIRIQQLKEKGN